MQILNVLEPIKEALNPRTSYDFKRMRLLGRINTFKWAGYENSWAEKLEALNAGHSNMLRFSETPKVILEDIRRDAFATGINLSPQGLAAILSYCDGSDFSPRNNSSLGYRISSASPVNPAKESIYAIFDPHKNCATVRALSEDLWVKGIANAYLGCASHLLSSQIWYTFPGDGGGYNPDFGFHYDIDDYRFLKLFFYLYDVGPDSGPHQIIKGSHRIKPFFRFFNRRLTDKAARRFAGHVQSMEMAAGGGFFEDTFCYHRGKVAFKPRLILQLEFSSTTRSSL